MKLKSHRQTMLKLNSRVHSWVTRQENDFNVHQLQPESPTSSSGAATGSSSATGQSTTERATADQSVVDAAAEQSLSGGSVSVGIVMDKCALDRELQIRLKDGVTDLYSSWDEAEAR